MLKINTSGLQFKIGLSITIFLFLILLVLATFNGFFVGRMSKDLSYGLLVETEKKIASDVTGFVQSSYDNLDGVSIVLEKLINDGLRDRNWMEGIMVEILTGLPSDIGGASLSFKPNFLDDDINYVDSKYSSAKGQFSVYVYRDPQGKILSRPFTAEELDADYYHIPMATKKPYVTDFYYFNIGGEDKLMYTWSVPIIEKNIVVGVMTVDLFAEVVQNMAQADRLYKDSIITLFSHTGVIVSPPAGRPDDMGKNIYDVFPSYKEDMMLERMSKGESFVYERKNSLNGVDSIYTVQAIQVSEGTYWGLMVASPKKEVFKESNFVLTVLIIFSIFIVLFINIFMFLTLKRKVLRPILFFLGDLERLAGGDLDWSPPVFYLKSKDEFGQLSRGLAQLLDRLNDTIGNVKFVSSQVESAANEVSSGNADLSHRTESQAAVLEETAASMEEMASSIKASADNAKEGNRMMAESKDSILIAGDIISSTTKNIEDVLASSVKINEITKIIESIALQTNILALNAAVEAARAGEQGRGFAVVASEVRELAQTTQTSVKNITELTAESNTKIKLATDTARRSKEIFVEIQAKIEDTSQIMQEITETAIEQQSGVEQINRAVTEMDVATQQNAALVQESTSSADALLSQAKDLVEFVDFFTTRSGSDENAANMLGSKSNIISPIKNNMSSINNSKKVESSQKYEERESKPSFAKAAKSSSGSEFGSGTLSSNSNDDNDFESF